jgi:transposase-like protein
MLTPEDTARLYSDAFRRQSTAMHGDTAFTISDLRAQLDVANHQISVLVDELGAKSKQLDEALASHIRENPVLPEELPSSEEGLVLPPAQEQRV